MIPNVAAYGLGAALLASLAFGGVQCSQKQAARTEAAEAQTELAEYRQEAAEAIARFEVEARATEQRHAADMTRIGREHREELNDAQTAADRLVSDLRAGNVRLQERWRGCAAAQVPGAGGTSGGADAGADDRSESAGRVVRAAAECDAQVKGLQSVILSDRKGE